MLELPLSYDIKIQANRTCSRSFRWLPGGEPQDFTDWTARMQVRQAVETPVLLELNTEDGGIELTDDGYINLTATIEQTTVLEDITRPRYDLVIASPDGSQVMTLLTGVIDVIPSISDNPSSAGG